MEKNKVLVLAGTLAVSGAMLLHSDVVNAASTTGSATVATTAASNLQNGSYTATAKLYKTGTTNDSMMSSMVLPTANVVIKNGQAIITLQFKDSSTSDMVKSWIIDGVSAVKKDNNFNVVLPVSDLNKTLDSTIHVETMIGPVPFTETQPVDINVTDLKFVARDPEEVAAEEKAKAEADAKAKADAVKAAAAEKAKQAASAKALAEAAAKAKAEQEANSKKRDQSVTKQYAVKLYKTGTTNDSMMTSMVSPTATVVTKDGQATVTLQFKDMATIDMVKSWVIDGVAATKSGQSFVVVLPASDLGKTLHTVISVATTIGGVPFSETQPVDLVLQAGKQPVPDPNPDENKSDAPAQTLGHDVPLTAQLSSTSKLPNTATDVTTTAPLLAALVSGVLALGIWFKKVLR
ncbi:MAG: NEAT domain-containing protein [Leuconostoc pseudomesenteroides]|uniref:NEAT domain-containing protein n=1 Tax=Leuconostoc pseudomesenteroides TaxID=33968 RepID=UPI0039EABE8B